MNRSTVLWLWPKAFKAQCMCTRASAVQGDSSAFLVSSCWIALIVSLRLPTLFTILSFVCTIIHQLPRQKNIIEENNVHVPCVFSCDTHLVVLLLRILELDCFTADRFFFLSICQV